uniref:Uncharacterized protein n=1 Tax=Arundo donax TaxID=35708 RepID=A0A0A9GYD5_ARUDO
MRTQVYSILGGGRFVKLVLRVVTFANKLCQM